MLTTTGLLVAIFVIGIFGAGKIFGSALRTLRAIILLFAALFIIAVLTGIVSNVFSIILSALLSAF